MHPLIHLALKQYVERRSGEEGWLDILERAGVTTPQQYVHVGEYRDQEFNAIVDAIAGATGSAVPDVLEDFGASIAAELITMYPRLVRPEWRSLDLICNAERTIHQIVRQTQKGARPPVLECLRVSPREVRLTYESRRNLCALATGIMRGVASHYGETLAIRQAACALRGDHACVFVVNLESTVNPGP